jgi:DNA-binding NtrC family response regulator
MTICESNPFGIVGRSAKTQQVLQNIEKVALGRWPVLVLGETGTGKDLVARSIHGAGAPGPFVTIDCSSLVGPLMESELFGHARGAFTGAVGSKLGLIEMANGGTAFFDEIGELPLDMQAKLLRVLQEKEFRPVGSLQQRRSDFRIVAATNRDLAKEVDRGTFRRDLYYRLNVVSLRLAPLRERTDDLDPLIDHFLSMYGNSHEVTGEVRDALHAYEWPGNVRELENCIQQMVAINTGPILHQHDLPSPVQNSIHARRAHSMAAAAVALGSTVMMKPPARAEFPDRPVGHDVPVLPLIEMERRAILRALEYTNGDRGVAAHLLGIGRTTLYRKLKEYQMAV